MASKKSDSLSVADNILNVIESYRLRASPFDPEIVSHARDHFLPLLAKAIEQQIPIPLVLPAFPFKSPNTAEKSLGVLPDKAEEVSLFHLQGLCDNIKHYYEHGAQLTIVSDGIVYNDLLGVSDDTVWTYGERLRQMAEEQSCSSIHFARLSNMPKLSNNIASPALLEYDDSESYQRAAPVLRNQLLTVFGEADYDVSQHIAADESVKATYLGYLRYLSKDLRKPGVADQSRKAFKRRVAKIAKQMVSRGKCYAACVKESFPDAIRLSIHAANSATKIPIGVVPNAQLTPITPWHSVMTCHLDGSMVAMPRSKAEELKLEPVTRDGQLWCYRERTPLYEWQDPAAATIEHLYPCGLIITAQKEGTAFDDVDMQRVRELAARNSPVILRGFAGSTNRDKFMAKGREMGQIMSWKFGELLVVKDGGGDSQGLNNVLSSEPMPMHYDGLFKVVNGVSTPPTFQMFTAVTASPKGTGRTLFANSTRLFQHLPGNHTPESLRGLTWRVETESFNASHFGNLPLIVDHPITGQPCIRYHEDWPQERTRFEPTRVHFEGVSQEEDDGLRAAVETALYDSRVCLHIEWEQGDVVVNDNILAMHTREGYTSGVGRELWRLHVD
ncbi:putative pyoverdine/dityrosine biosynthesis protein [Saccharata proteae CBS 121410]|uniref:Pyoverdine/dityrosine biosynthesis protein n=1 Tax=Saccharata proteae CBS 121410 TaxID=1314787 RepID=A0A9P4HTE6_9PEZI|nr:putative pyoverdine/dityrosine biosynthesis protein [Saccharata proteae CBS 121410]